MSKTQRNIGIVVGAIIVIILALPLFINVNSFRPKIESELSSALGRKVDVGDLSLSILRGRVSAENISIADDPAFSQSPFLTAKSVKIGVKLLPLIFSKKLSITGITLDEPAITLLSLPSGKWNVSTLGGGAPKTEAPTEAAPTGNLSIAKLEVTGGKLVVGKANSKDKPLTIENLDIELEDFSSTTQFPFTLAADLPGSGSLKLEGKAGPLVPGATPLQAKLIIKKLDLASIGADPSMGLGGISNLEGTLESNGKTAKVGGTLSLEKLKLSPKGSPARRDVEVKFATDYDLARQAGTITTGDLSVGKAVARLTGNYQAAGDATLLNMKLNAPGLPIDEVESLLPALGVTLPSGSGLKGGTISASLGISGPTDKLVIDGPIKLENSKLEGFSLDSKLSAVSGKGGGSKDTTIQNASASTRLAPDGTRLDAINVSVPSLGTLTGSGSVSPAGALNFSMVADLAGGERETQRASRREERGGIPFSIEGTTSDPKFVPNVKGMAGAAAKGAISGKAGAEGESASKGLFRRR